MESKLTVTMTDHRGRQTRVGIEIEGVDVATMVTSAGTIAGHLDAMSRMGVVKGVLQIPLSGIASAAADPSNTDVGGKAKGVSDDDGKTVNLRLPDPIDAAVNADGTIDLTHLDVAAYLAHFETGGDAELSDGEQVTSWRFGVLDAR